MTRRRSETELEEAIFELRKKKSANPKLPENKTSLWWDDESNRRRDPETDGVWLLDDPVTGRTFAITTVDLWTTHIEGQDPDEIIGEGAE